LDFHYQNQLLDFSHQNWLLDFPYQKTFYRNWFYYWTKLNNFKTNFCGIGLIAYSTIFLFFFLKVLKALYLWNWIGDFFWNKLTFFCHTFVCRSSMSFFFLCMLQIFYCLYARSSSLYLLEVYFCSKFMKLSY
jgi:hypothetical protein